MTYSKFLTARKPKIEGTRNLHNYFESRSMDLDFFVMLSSLAGILGNVSQSNYAAGNTYQDTLAHHRAANGLPALSIDVGMVTDVGWTASNPDIIRVGKENFQQELTSQDLIALVDYHVTSWNSQKHDRDAKRSEKGRETAVLSPQVAIGVSQRVPGDARFAHLTARRAILEKASKIAAAATGEGAKEHASARVRLAAAGDERAKLIGVMEEALGEKLAQILSLPREKVHLDDTFVSHGVDSLIAVEIRGWVSKELGGKLLVNEILGEKMSVRDLVGKIVDGRGGT